MKKSEPKMILNISLSSEEIEEKVKIAMDEYVQKVIYKNLDELSEFIEREKEIENRAACFCSKLE